MSVTELLPILGGISGLLGGTLGVLSWIKTNKKDKLSFNQLTYMNHIKHSYKKCFENARCRETDNVNMYYLWDLIDNLREFQKHDNKFKGMGVNSTFRDALLYADVIKFGHFTPLNWFFDHDKEVNNEHTIADYLERKTHIQRLKPFFRDFYLSIFENID